MLVAIQRGAHDRSAPHSAYVRIGTPDLARRRTFRDQDLGARGGRTPNAGSPTSVSDDRTNTIAYVEGDPAQHAVAFEVSEKRRSRGDRG